MKKCKRNVILIFGYLAIVSILFVPIYAPEYSPKKHFWHKKTFMFTPIFISKVIRQGRFNIMEYIKRYRLRLDFFLTEIAFILLTGGFAYILFCVVLRKEKRGER